MSRDINPFGLRMPPELREAAEKSAGENGRSLNSEIVFQLRRLYFGDKITAPQRRPNK